jgi:hypothetical protein
MGLCDHLGIHERLMRAERGIPQGGALVAQSRQAAFKDE